jgi:hypothetical protein
MKVREYILQNWMRGFWHPAVKESDTFIRMIADRMLASRSFDITNVQNYVQKVFENRKEEIPLNEKMTVRLPYPVCYFEFHRDEPHGNGQIDHLDCGALLWESPWDETRIIAHTFMLTESCKGRVYPIVDFEFPRDLDEGFHRQSVKYTMRPRIKEMGYIEKNMLMIGYRICEPVMYSLALLNCKNIRTQVQTTHDGRSKAERKRIFHQEFHVLHVPLINRISSGEINVSKDQHGVPIHTVRGHVKTYTAEKPLMGKHVGQWWWEPQIRGNAKYGIIEKEYHATVPSSVSGPS